MKKNALFVLSLLILTITGLSLSSVSASTTMFGDNPIDEGGDGFVAEDHCGYVYGTADTYYDGSQYETVKFTSVDNTGSSVDNTQGCAETSGYFYSSAARDSYFQYSYGSPLATTLTVDLDYYNGVMGCGPTGVDACDAVIDQSTGRWSGYARFIDGTMPAAKRDVWFNWTCARTATPAACAALGAVPKVQTDLTTGVTSGYAWNDYFGFMLFDGLNWELPPETVDMFVDVLSSNDVTGPEAATYITAPVADGEDFWRVRVQFANGADYLTEADIASLNITLDETADSTIYLNQVEDSGDAVIETDVTYLSDYDCLTEGVCVHTDTDGAESWTTWNTFVKSAAPTSNMLGLNDDTDPSLEYLGDREGCRWIYHDQWSEVDHRGSQPVCPGVSGTPYAKTDYFYDRVSDRNQYILEHVNVEVTFTRENTTVNTGTYTTQDSSNPDLYIYSPYSSDGTAGLPLSFRPRYQSTLFSAYYDSALHDQISADTSEAGMRLKSQATVAPTSLAFQAHFPGMLYPAYDVNYQVDADSECSSPLCGSVNDLVLMLENLTDTTAPDPDGNPDCARRMDAVAVGASGATYNAEYPMGYGQKDVACTGASAPTGSPANTLSNPTAEQWVCDYLRESVSGQNPQYSCYYTGYLPRVDRHATADDMVVMGAINATVDQGSFLDNGSTLSQLGTGDITKLRNKMVALVGRYILGKGSASSGVLEADTFEPSSGLLSLLGGRLVYGEGDVVIDGGSSVPSMTLVTKGNVIIRGNITGGHMGIIALRDDDGERGNVYVAPEVTDVYANIFADGALLPYDGVTVPTALVEFDWDTVGGDETRYSTLLNQFYLNGSLVSRNTINGADPSEAPDCASHYASCTPATTWQLGNGTTTTDYGKAREHDLNLFRQYRLCYTVDTDGSLVEPLVDCGEGARLSGSSASADFAALDEYPSFILEYSPADDLPIFRAESGLFQ